MSNLSDDDSSEYRLYSSDSSEASSISSEHLEDSFYSASEEFFPYNYNNVESVEPIATEQEAAVYAVKLAQEEEEEEILWSRFSGEDNVENW